MSTRSIIVITGPQLYGSKNKTIRLYKHSDGYPTGNLPIIERALGRATEMVSSDNARFSKDEPKPIYTETLVGLLIGESTSVYGIGARIDSYEDDTAEYNSEFKPEHLGEQSDLEWIYIIDLEAKTLNIYGGSYGTGLEAVNNGPTDPSTYADQLSEEFKEDERNSIKNMVKMVEAWSFKVNPKKKSTRTTRTGRTIKSVSNSKGA